MAASIKTLLLLLALLFCVAQTHSNEDGHADCTHDDEDQNPEVLDIEEDFSANEEGRNLASKSYSNIRLYPYFGFLGNTPSSYTSYLQHKLIGPIVDYFQAALKVKYPVAGNLKLGSSVSNICDQKTPSILKSGVATDYFIFFLTYADSSNLIAATKYCYLASGSKRPIISRTNINRNMLKITSDVLVHERSMNTLMHEMMHTMGFSGSLYRNFLDENGKTRKNHIKSVKIAGSTRTVIDVPPLTDRMRKFFGCSSLQGAIMENSGGSLTAASHFERKFFFYETMSSGAIYGGRLSQFTLAMLEGSGWYIPDYSYAEPFYFGQGQGCSYISGSCSSSSYDFSEFCSGSSRGCGSHADGGASCGSDSIGDGCRFYKPSLSYHCQNPNGDDYATLPSLQKFGRDAGSRCFTGSLNSRKSSSTNSFCFTYTCSGSGSSTTLDIHVGKSTIKCTKAGKKTVSGYYGTVDCPDPMTFCGTVGKQYCPKNCMGRGKCVNNKCQCKSGYKGADCALLA